MVILNEELRGSWERKTESSLSLEPSFGYSSFWRGGNTFVSSQIRRFSSPTVSSPQTRTVYSLPLHLTLSVSSSDEPEPEPESEAKPEPVAINPLSLFLFSSLPTTLHHQSKCSRFCFQYRYLFFHHFHFYFNNLYFSSPLHWIFN